MLIQTNIQIYLNEKFEQIFKYAHIHFLKETNIQIYDKKSDEGSNSVRMRPENSGALKVVKK